MYLKLLQRLYFTFTASSKLRLLFFLAGFSSDLCLTGVVGRLPVGVDMAEDVGVVGAEGMGKASVLDMVEEGLGISSGLAGLGKYGSEGFESNSNFTSACLIAGCTLS